MISGQLLSGEVLEGDHVVGLETARRRERRKVGE